MGMYQGQKIELQVKKLKYSSSYITKFYLFFFGLVFNEMQEGLALFICRWEKNRWVI